MKSTPGVSHIIWMAPCAEFKAMMMICRWNSGQKRGKAVLETEAGSSAFWCIIFNLIESVILSVGSNRMCKKASNTHAHTYTLTRTHTHPHALWLRLLHSIIICTRVRTICFHHKRRKRFAFINSWASYHHTHTHTHAHTHIYMHTHTTYIYTHTHTHF